MSNLPLHRRVLPLHIHGCLCPARLPWVLAPPVLGLLTHLRQPLRLAGGNQACQYYTVQTGDTLDAIGGYFGIPRQDILAINPSVNPAALAPNSFVKLPPWDEAVCPEPGNGQACRVYIAETGDSLSVIATAFSIPLADLQTQNAALGVDSTTVLQPGMRVQLPPFPDNCGDGGLQPY